MPDNEKTLTTAEYAKKAGLATSTVARMLRDGKLRGEKRGGKWVIYADAPESGSSEKKQPAAKTPSGPAPISNNPPSSTTSYDIEAFSRLTFLTENGVRQWLKDGRLSGGTDSSGNLKVDASNLERAEFKHLVR
ncbi:helix-turn-helix domain-containing protein [uncultured Desulfosarcina sp.]|uniref:helix-turn-helix domain-containing protein n=1 Tax=uncultured Desulfosarcina sp. TaxID=218289 RepID=UPI0029C65048|nr:helix-turn-helix domain-containing protein [uncultured Desulfosarcina sp.]